MATQMHTLRLEGLFTEEAMRSTYDIFQKLPEDQTSWVEAVEGFDAVMERLKVLMRIAPAEYIAYDLVVGKVVAVVTQNLQ